MKKPYDPKLREAVGEMQKVCKKYDCIGAVILASPTHAEFGYMIQPNWSVLRLENLSDGSMGIRFRSKEADFPSKEAQKFATEATAHGVTTLYQFGQRLSQDMGDLIASLRRHTTLLFETWGEKPDSWPGDGK